MNKQRSSALHHLIGFTMRFHCLNWGLVNFLFEIGIVIAAVIWACLHKPALVAPLIGWIATGLVIFLVLLALAIVITRAVILWCNAKQAYQDEKLDISKEDTKY